VIIDFYLGKGSERDVMAAAGKTDERCDADFYLGEWHLLHDKRAEAAKALRAATADDCPKYLFEYVGAVIDLKRLAP
jgi:lipoprotein NlpI